MKKILVPVLALLALGACSTTGNLGIIGTDTKVIDRTGQKMTFLSTHEIRGESCRWAFFDDLVQGGDPGIPAALNDAIAGYIDKHRNEAHPDALANVSVKTSMRTWFPGVATHVCTTVKGIPVEFTGVPNKITEPAKKGA